MADDKCLGCCAKIRIEQQKESNYLMNMPSMCIQQRLLLKCSSIYYFFFFIFVFFLSSILLVHYLVVYNFLLIFHLSLFECYTNTIRYARIYLIWISIVSSIPYMVLDINQFIIFIENWIDQSVLYYSINLYIKFYDRRTEWKFHSWIEVNIARNLQWSILSTSQTVLIHFIIS